MFSAAFSSWMVRASVRVRVRVRVRVGLKVSVGVTIHICLGSRSDVLPSVLDLMQIMNMLFVISVPTVWVSQIRVRVRVRVLRESVLPLLVVIHGFGNRDSTCMEQRLP